MKLPHMQRLPYALARCSLPHCNRQAAFIGGHGFKLCHMHMTLFRIGNAKAEALQSAGRKAFDLDAVGDLDEHGNPIHNPGAEE